MDALFVIVAELLIVPLILWALLILELTIGVLASVVAIFAGRRSPSEALEERWRAVRRRLLWSLILMTSGLMLADLLFFESFVHLALSSIDERDDIELRYAHAEGSFILGRIEFDDIELSARRGDPDDPDDRYSFVARELVIDIDTRALLTLNFRVEELALEGVRGELDRLRATDPQTRKTGGAAQALARNFTLERLHVGTTTLVLRDHTKSDPDHPGDRPPTVTLTLDELDAGPLRSEAPIFDLLYRTRGTGSLDGHPFVLRTAETDGVPSSTIELRDIPLEALGASLEARAGLRASGTADLVLDNRYRGEEGGAGASVEIRAEVTLHDLELQVGPDAGIRAKLMLDMATGVLEQLGADFPLAFSIEVEERELAGLRSVATSGIPERVADAIADALQAQLREAKSRPD